MRAFCFFLQLQMADMSLYLLSPLCHPSASLYYSLWPSLQKAPAAGLFERPLPRERPHKANPTPLLLLSFHYFVAASPPPGNKRIDTHGSTCNRAEMGRSNYSVFSRHRQFEGSFSKPEIEGSNNPDGFSGSQYKGFRQD